MHGLAGVERSQAQQAAQGVMAMRSTPCSPHRRFSGSRNTSNGKLPSAAAINRQLLAAQPLQDKAKPMK
jgi:hypothetical protein